MRSLFLRHSNICFAFYAAILFVGSTSAAAVPDDIPACRCLENLAETDGDSFDENLRREASSLVRNHCDEDLPLELLSGSEKWLAEESCELLHASFHLATSALDERSRTSGADLRVTTTAVYRGHRLDNDQFTDWRHNTSFLLQFHITIRPRQAAQFSLARGNQ